MRQHHHRVQGTHEGRTGEGRLTRPPLRFSYPKERSHGVLHSNTAGRINPSLGVVPRPWCRTSCVVTALDFGGCFDSEEGVRQSVPFKLVTCGC